MEIWGGQQCNSVQVWRPEVQGCWWYKFQFKDPRIKGLMVWSPSLNSKAKNQEQQECQCLRAEGCLSSGRESESTPPPPSVLVKPSVDGKVPTCPGEGRGIFVQSTDSNTNLYQTHVTDTPRKNVSQLSGHPLALPNWHKKLATTAPEGHTHVHICPQHGHLLSAHLGEPQLIQAPGSCRVKT